MRSGCRSEVDASGRTCAERQSRTQIRHDIVHEIDDDSALLRYRAPASACRLDHLGLLEHAWVSIDQNGLGRCVQGQQGAD